MGISGAREAVPSLQEIREAITPVLHAAGAQKAILFGSYARGDADEYSDVDLLVVAESRRPFIERCKDFLGMWHVSPVKAIDLFVYTPKEFRKMQSQDNPLIARAIREGELVYEARPTAGSRQGAAAGRE
jgi:predicted nucleotidyltransferase